MAFCGLEKTRYVNVLVVACRDMKNLPGEFRIHTEEEEDCLAEESLAATRK